MASRHLTEKGYDTLERNYRTRHGEIALIMRGEHALVFVEVKLRRGTEFDDPLEVVTGKTLIRNPCDAWSGGGEGSTSGMCFLRADYRWETRARSLNSLPLGGSSPLPPMTYWRSL